MAGSNGTRMAGEKVANLEKDDNWDARAQRYENEERRESKLGVVDREKYDLKGYSDKDIFMSFKGDEFGDKDYERLTGKKIGGDSGGDSGNDNNTDAGSQTPSPKVSGSGSGNSAANSSTINGNNNSVDQSITQNINNSRNYGGDSRSFTYNGGKNSATDTPVSMATMAGHYAPNDSHSANAARLDRQVQQNTDIQKQLRESAPSSYIDPEKMDNRVRQREAYSRAKAKTMGGNLFGDMFSMKPPEWNSAEPAKEVESPDFDAMYNKYTKF